MKKIVAIYSIVNRITNKLYIGSSNNIDKRIRGHFYRLRKKNHVNRHLQSSYNIYGKKNFEIVILEKCSEKVLISREQYYLDLYKSYDRTKGYNVLQRADRKRLTKEVREKISRSMLGHKVSISTRLKMSKVNSLRRHTAETKQKISESMKRFFQVV